MSIPYRQIFRRAGIAVTAVTGTTASALTTNYLTSPLTSTQIGNTDFPFPVIADSLVSVIGTIVRAYASVPNHPFRTYNISQTSNIAHKGLIPSANSAGTPIVGVYGAIRDSSSGEECTEQPAQIIRTIIDNNNSALLRQYYHFKQVGDRLWHTRANVVMDVCTFSASDELTAINANGNAPIPDALLDAAWAGLVSTLFVDDEFITQAQMCGQYFQGVLSDIAQNKTSFLPAPVLQSSQQPAIS